MAGVSTDGSNLKTKDWTKIMEYTTTLWKYSIILVQSLVLKGFFWPNPADFRQPKNRWGRSEMEMAISSSNEPIWILTRPFILSSSFHLPETFSLSAHIYFLRLFPPWDLQTYGQISSPLQSPIIQ